MACTEVSEAKQMPNTQFLYPVHIITMMFLIALFKQVNQHTVSYLTQTVKVPYVCFQGITYRSMSTNTIFHIFICTYHLINISR